MFATLVQVALGGALGAMARYLTGVATRHAFGITFPWGTLTVNIVGSFLMGVLVVALANEGGTRFAPFLMIGLLGGFTTFSSFSLDAVLLYERGEVGLAAGYVVVSVVCAILGLFAGMSMTRAVFS